MLSNYNMGKTSKIQAYMVTNQPIAQSMPFFVNSFGHFVCDNTYFTERQDHPEYLLLYTIGGKGKLIYQGKTISLSSNQLAVIDCRQYQYYACEEDLWDFYWIHFNGVSAGVFTELLYSGGFQSLTLGTSFDFLKYYQNLLTCSKHFSKRAEMKISELMHHLFCEIITLLDQNVFIEKVQAHQEDIQRAIDYMMKYYNRALTVAELAHVSQLSKYHFIRLFQKATGNTPYQYLNFLRINQSKRLLLQTELSISEISQQVGFQNTKNYITCFKKYHTITPLQFRLHSSF